MGWYLHGLLAVRRTGLARLHGRRCAWIRLPPSKPSGEHAPGHSLVWTSTFWQYVFVRGKRGHKRPPLGTCVVPPRLNPKLLNDDGHRSALIFRSDGLFYACAWTATITAWVAEL